MEYRNWKLMLLLQGILNMFEYNSNIYIGFLYSKFSLINMLKIKVMLRFEKTSFVIILNIVFDIRISNYK